MYLPNESPISSKKWIVTSLTLNDKFWFKLTAIAPVIIFSKWGYINFLDSRKSVKVSKIF